jgi:ubiquinone/menaquinone biosynthesis C-methylase UbiE
MEKPTQEHPSRVISKRSHSPGLIATPPCSVQQYNFIARRENVSTLFDETEGTYLDAGCGTGDFIPGLVARGGNIIGLDLSCGMLEQTRARS